VAQHNPSFPFFEGTYSSLKAEARQRQLPFLLVFTLKDDSLSDTWVNTLNMPRVVQFVGDRFLALRVHDMGAPEPTYGRGGANLSAMYGVLLYPTTILCDAQGTVLVRFAGVESAQAFLDTLARFLPQQNRMVPPVVVETWPSHDQHTEWGEEPEVIAPEPDPDKMGMVVEEIPDVPEVASKPVIVTYLPGEASSQELPDPQAVSHLGKDAFTLYQVRTQVFVVQAGAFSSYANVKDFAQRLETTYAPLPVHLLLYDKADGTRMYKIYLGNFGSQAEAEVFRDRYKTESGKDAMVVAL